MSAPRIVIIVTADHGEVTIPEPAWCRGNHRDGGARIDITHTSADRPLTLPTREGPAVHLTTWLESRPYVADSFLRGPFVAVEVDGHAYPTGLAGLERMAAELEAHAEQLRDHARELAVILAEDGAR